MTAARRAVEVLRRLNKARRTDDEELDYTATVMLEALDERGGYLRDVERNDVIPEGQRSKGGKQRNPEWRAALDKHNAMRGRTR